MKDDTISRSAAIEALNASMIFGRCNEKTVTFEALKKYAEGVRERIDALPSAQQWIPCSERLPKENEEVLVSTTDHIFIAVLETIQGTRYWSEVIEYRTLYDVIAWCPIPEPYKEEADD